MVFNRNTETACKVIYVYPAKGVKNIYAQIDRLCHFIPTLRVLTR